MNLAELRAACEAEGIDPGDANLRAEFIAAIEAGPRRRRGRGMSRFLDLRRLAART